MLRVQLFAIVLAARTDFRLNLFIHCHFLLFITEKLLLEFKPDILNADLSNELQVVIWTGFSMASDSGSQSDGIQKVMLPVTKHYYGITNQNRIARNKCLVQ